MNAPSSLIEQLFADALAFRHPLTGRKLRESVQRPLEPNSPDTEAVVARLEIEKQLAALTPP